MENHSKELGRVYWFKEIARIYNQIGYSRDDCGDVYPFALPKQDILTELSKRTHKPLYEHTHNSKGFTCREVYENIQLLEKDSVTWDDILDNMRDISKIQPPRISLKNPSESKENFSMLDWSHPKVKLTRVPYEKLSNLLLLSLAGNKLSDATYSFPSSLILLNLSENSLKSLVFGNPLPNLQLLNLSHNKLSSFNLKTSHLQELYIAANLLVSLEPLCTVDSLALLDASSNKLCSTKSIAGLQRLPNLLSISLKHNLVTQGQNYHRSLKQYAPTAYTVDPPCIEHFSMFTQFRRLAFSRKPALKKPTHCNTSRKSVVSQKNDSIVRQLARTPQTTRYR